MTTRTACTSLLAASLLLVVPNEAAAQLPVATGTGVRYGIAIIVYEASQPSTMQMDEATAPKLASCGGAPTR